MNYKFRGFKISDADASAYLNKGKIPTKHDYFQHYKGMTRKKSFKTKVITLVYTDTSNVSRSFPVTISAAVQLLSCRPVHALRSGCYTDLPLRQAAMQVVK